MVTDPIFYRLFQSIPETLFLLMGRSLAEAKRMAAAYQFHSIELKETAARIDGVYIPAASTDPLYFVEVSFYALESIFADILAKGFMFLKQNDPGQEFNAVVLLATRSMMPKGLAPYREHIRSGLLTVIVLDELPEDPNAPLGVSIVNLIGKSESEAPKRGRELIDRARSEIAVAADRNGLIQLIETVIIHKLPTLSREEIQAMLGVHDIRETRVYQEAREEGREEGQDETKVRLIGQCAALKWNAARIAKFLELDVKRVRRELAKLKTQ